MTPAIIGAVLGFVLGTVIYRQIKGGPYWVQYIDMAYDGGGQSWIQKYRCRIFAVVGKFYNNRIGSWGGTMITTNIDPRLPKNRELLHKRFTQHE